MMHKKVAINMTFRGKSTDKFFNEQSCSLATVALRAIAIIIVQTKAILCSELQQSKERQSLS